MQLSHVDASELHVDASELPSGTQWYFLSATAISALGAHYCLAKALGHADVGVLMPFDYLRLPIIALIGWFIYQEPMTWPLAIGSLIIIMGNAVGLYTAEKRVLC